MKRGLILNNAYFSAEHYLNQSKRLKEELALLGVDAEIRRNDFFAATITEGGDIDTELIKQYDFCIYYDKDKYVSLMLDRAGMRLFNPHSAMEACDDKMTTAIKLAGHGIPMPLTLPGLLCFDPTETVRAETLDGVEKRLGYPLIVKTSYGSLGKGVYKIDNRGELSEIANKLKCTPHLYQKYISSSFGRDMRVIVIGGKFVAAMIRQSGGDFRSNIELGGHGEAVIPPSEVIAMCENAAAILGLDYCGIDVLFGDMGYYICEINSNAFFGGIESVTKINIARLYAKHIYNVIYG